MPLKALIFDVDGTLAETEEAHRAAFNRAFAAHGLDWHWDQATYGRLLGVTGGKERIRSWADSLPDASMIDDAMIRKLHQEKTDAFVDIVASGMAPRQGIDALIAKDPTHAETYLANAEAYQARLTDLDAWVRAQTATVPDGQRVLVTAHDAFNYFGQAYDFEVRGLQGLSTATEAGTADVRDLAVFVAERRIPAMFVETSVSPRNIQAVLQAVRARGFEVEIGGNLFSDALGDPGSPEGTYEGMVRHNVSTIVSALGGGE